MKKLKHILEAAIVQFFLLIFKILPANVASWLGGAIAKTLGPLLSVNKLAKRNINKAFPSLKIEEVNKICLDMWDNLGRVVAEFAHLNGYIDNNLDEIVEVDGLEHITKAQESGRTIIFFGGHCANWEIIPKIIGREFDEIAIVYRKANNPYTDKIITDARGASNVVAIPKGSVGARKIIGFIKKNKPIIMLVDQKQNDGIKVPFFGHDAMTAPAIANLAIKHNCAILPISVRRIDSSLKFKLEVLPEVCFKNENSAYDVMVSINQQLEDVIKKEPAQWFWVHNRWIKNK